MGKPKRSPLSFAQPRGETTGSTAQRVDVLSKALDEAGQGPGSPTTQKPQRSRVGLVSTSIWLSKQARMELKHHAQASADTTMEQYILDAVNEKLEKDGASFLIK